MNARYRSVRPLFSVNFHQARPRPRHAQADRRPTRSDAPALFQATPRADEAARRRRAGPFWKYGELVGRIDLRAETCQRAVQTERANCAFRCIRAKTTSLAVNGSERPRASRVPVKPPRPAWRRRSVAERSERAWCGSAAPITVKRRPPRAAAGGGSARRRAG